MVGTRPDWARKVRKLVIDMGQNNKRCGKVVVFIPEKGIVAYQTDEQFLCAHKSCHPAWQNKICPVYNATCKGWIWITAALLDQWLCRFELKSGNWFVKFHQPCYKTAPERFEDANSTFHIKIDCVAGWTKKVSFRNRNEQRGPLSNNFKLVRLVAADHFDF